MGTKIEWCNRTWNPIRARNKETGRIGWHCTKVSAGCKACYAEAMNRWRGTGLPFAPASQSKVELFLDEKVLEQPLHWKKPQKVFVCDMTDLFGEWVPDGWIADVFGVMASASQHTFQVLTKRPDRMRKWMLSTLDERKKWSIGTEFGRSIVNQSQLSSWPLPNVWLGVSCEDQKTADERIPILLQTPAAVRFVSAEPLLRPVDLSAFTTLETCAVHHSRSCCGRKPPIDWVILGGESGPGARPCDLAWLRSIKDQCRAAGTKVFVKQIGSRPTFFGSPTGRVEYAMTLKHPKGGDPAEWPEDLRVREYPQERSVN